MKKPIAITAAAVLLIAIALLLTPHISRNIAMSSQGLRAADAETTVLYDGTDMFIHDRVQIVTKLFDYSGDTPGLVMLRQGFLGVWSVWEAGKNELATDIRRVTTAKSIAQGMSEFETEMHLFYCGDNAVRLIDIADKLPGYAVNVLQDGKNYMIHLITYAQTDELGDIPIPDPKLFELLREEGMIT